MQWKLHDENSAPEESRELLNNAKGKYGFVPNLLGVMSESPALLEAYLTLSGIFDRTSFNSTEKQVILLAVSYANGCSYCMSAHTAIAGMHGVPQDVTDALREDSPIEDEKLEALRRLAFEIGDTRGRPSDQAVENFLNAGYSRGQFLEVILGAGLKTLSNYTNHIAETPLDRAFEDTKWEGCDAA